MRDLVVVFTGLKSGDSEPAVGAGPIGAPSARTIDRRDVRFEEGRSPEGLRRRDIGV